MKTIRPARIYKDKKADQYYVMEGKKIHYLPKNFGKLKKDDRKREITVITNIVNKLSDKRKKKRVASSSKKIKNGVFTEPIVTTSMGSVNKFNSSDPILRNMNNSFSLMLPYFMSGKFSNMKALEDLNKKVNKIEETIPSINAGLIKPPEEKIAIMPPVPVVIQGGIPGVQLNRGNNAFLDFADPGMKKRKTSPATIEVEDDEKPQDEDEEEEEESFVPFKKKSVVKEPISILDNKSALKSNPTAVYTGDIYNTPVKSFMNRTSSKPSNSPLIPNEDDEKVSNRVESSAKKKVEAYKIAYDPVVFPEFEQARLASRGKKGDPTAVMWTDKDGVKHTKVFKTQTDLTFLFEGETTTGKKLAKKTQKYNVYKLSGWDADQLNTQLNNQKDPTLGRRNFIITNLRGLDQNSPTKTETSTKSGNGKIIEKLAKSKGKYNSALYDTELVEILAPYREFQGVIMRDELKALLDKMNERDEDKFGFIMNLDKSSQQGSHWIAIYCDLRDKKMIGYYNSFGVSIPADILKVLKDFVKKRGMPYYIKIKDNGVVHQVNESNRCGYHASRFLINMFKNQSFENATDYDVWNGESDASEKEKTFRKFGYI